MNVNQPKWNRATKIPNDWNVCRVKQSMFQSMLAFDGVLDSVGVDIEPTTMYGHLRQISLLTWWWNHEIFLEHIGILISFWKIILESSLMFKSCRSWPHKSLSMTISGHDLWTKKVLQIPGCTPDFSWKWHLDTLTPWSRHWNGKHWTLGFDPPILTTSKVKKWWCCRNCVKDLGHRKKGEGGRKSISPAIFVFEGFLVT